MIPFVFIETIRIVISRWKVFKVVIEVVASLIGGVVAEGITRNKWKYAAIGAIWG